MHARRVNTNDPELTGNCFKPGEISSEFLTPLTGPAGEGREGLRPDSAGDHEEDPSVTWASSECSLS